MADYRPTSTFVPNEKLEQARAENRAKWEAIYLERDRIAREAEAAQELALKQAAEPYFNPSLAGAISPRLGPGFQHGYDPRVKHFVQSSIPNSLQGLHQIKGTGEKDIALLEQADHGIVHATVPTLEGHVYEFGPEPDARIFGHEFRHRAGVHNEYDNRIYDAMYSQTPEDWEDALFFYKDWRNATRKAEGSPPLTREEAQRDLLWTLEHHGRWFREREWDLAPENAKPYPQDYVPNFGDFLIEAFGADDNNKGKYMYRSNPPYLRVIEEMKKRAAPPPTPVLPPDASLGDVFGGFMNR